MKWLSKLLTSKAGATLFGSPVVAALGGALFGSFIGRRKQGRRDAEGSIRDRLKIGEDYGIHPLSMLGTSGNTFGTGGMQGIQMAADLMRDAQLERKHGDPVTRAKEDREDRQDHEMLLEHIRQARLDKRVSDAKFQWDKDAEAFKNVLNPISEQLEHILKEVGAPVTNTYNYFRGLGEDYSDHWNNPE